MPGQIAERIRALRVQRGWSKIELGRRIGGKNPRVMIHRWESGLVIPSPANVKRLAEVFTVPVADVDPSGSAYNLTGPRTKSHGIDKSEDMDKIPPSLPTKLTEGPMKDQIDAVVGALNLLDEDKRPAFVAKMKKIAASMVLGIDVEDAGAMPAKQRRVSGKG